MKKESGTSLQQTLKEKMSEIGISVHALEKKAGLKRSAVQNILHGRSKNPSAQILNAVSKILDCDIDELLNNPDGYVHASSKSENASEKSFNIALYAQAAKVAAEIFEKTNADLNANSTLAYIKEIYQYAIDSQLLHIDQNFASWLIGRYPKQ